VRDNYQGKKQLMGQPFMTNMPMIANAPPPINTEAY
jgi:hypothetical protein